MQSLSVRAADPTSFPQWESPWTADINRYQEPCVTYALGDPNLRVELGHCGNVLTQRGAVRITSVDDVPMSSQLKQLEGSSLYPDALMHWRRAVEDGFIPVEPDEHNVLDVPQGMYPVLLTIRGKKLRAPRFDDKGGKYDFLHHFYRANQPDESGQIYWSHWDGERTPEPTCMDGVMRAITDPAEQCKADHYYPVGYFLAPSAHALKM